MKKTRRTSLLIVLALILVFALCLPLAVSADGGDGEIGSVAEEGGVGGTIPVYEEPVGEELEEGVVYIRADAESIELDLGTQYCVSVYAVCGDGASYASYQMTFTVPSFMSVDRVWIETYQEDDTYAYNANGQTVSVSYASDVDRAGGALFNVYFYLNEDAEDGSSDHFRLQQALFTNTSFEELGYTSSFGWLTVYEPNLLPLKGDFDLDGEVTLEDVIGIQQAIVGLRSMNGDDGFYAADVNRDNMVNILDVQYIRAYLIGSIDSLEDIYSETVAIKIELRILSPYDDTWGAYTVSVVYEEGEEPYTYLDLYEFFMSNSVIWDRFPDMIYDSAYTASGVSVFDETSIVTHDDIIFVCREKKGDEPFTYDESEVQTNGWLNGDTIRVYQNCEPADIWEVIEGKTFAIERYVMRDGTHHTVGYTEVTLTADNLGDLTGIDFSEVGENVDLPIVVNGETYYTNVRIIPDLRNVQKIGEAVRIETHVDQFGQTETYRYYAALYANNIMATCSFDQLGNDDVWYSYMNFTVEYDNDVTLYAVDEGGMVCYYVIDENASYEGYPIVSAYAPAADDPTEEYLLAIEGYQLKFVVFNECYAMTYHSMGAADVWEFGGTVKVEVDLENGTFAFRDIVYDIGGDNVLSIGLPDEAPVEVVYYMGETIVFNLYEDGSAYYMMNGEVMGTATWEYARFIETSDGEFPVELIITMMGEPQSFYVWYDGNWYMMEEPDFEEATATEVMLDGETATVYVWEGQDKALLKRGEEAPFEIGYYNASARMFSLYGMEAEYYLIRDGGMFRVDYCQLIYDGNTQYIYVGDGYAYGWLGALSGYQGIDMTYVVDEDGLWTFYDGLNEVMTCTKEQDNVFVVETATAPVEGEETVTLTMKALFDGQVAENLTQSGPVPVGASLGELREMIGSRRTSEDGGTVYECTDVCYDIDGRRPISEKDVVTKDVVLYVFYVTVEVS